MTTTANKTQTPAQQIAAQLRAQGISNRQVSVRMSAGGGALYATVKDASIKLATVEAIANKFQHVSRCEMTHEILSGGNLFVTVRYDSEVIRAEAAKYLPAINAIVGTGNTCHDIVGNLSVSIEGHNEYKVWLSREDGCGHCIGRAWDAEHAARIIALAMLARENTTPEPTPPTAGPTTPAPSETMAASDVATSAPASRAKSESAEAAYKPESNPPKAAATTTRLGAASDVWANLQELRTEGREHFVCFDLNARHHVIAKRVVSIGSLSGVEVHPREVFRPAIVNGAAAVIFAHNHPSGDPSPSRQDLELTSRLVQVAELVGIKVLDHVVVAEGGYISMAEKGWV